jgi:hypothetical protein
MSGGAAKPITIALVDDDDVVVVGVAHLLDPYRDRVLGSMLLLAALAACGSGGATDRPAPSGQDELVIVARTGEAPTVTWRLTCNPPRGSHPDPATACRVLTEHGDQALPAVPGNRACTQLYGGPETATITGRWRGRSLHSSFSRTNGCEIARWTALTGLLPAPAH